MIEKFYIAEEGSELRKDYLNYIENSEQVRKIVNKFFEKFGITAESYYAGNKMISIVATKEDKDKFQSQLCIPKDGLSRFKANSKINKAWVDMLKKSNVEVLFKPRVPFYFDRGFGSVSSRLFEINGVVYCSLKSEMECESRDNLREIKGSEFFKVVEDYNEGLKENENV